MTDLQDKVVVITGGSAGVGRAAAEAFAREGARVAVLARGQERLNNTVQELERLGAQAMSVPVDVADPQQVENAAQRVEEQLGPIDVWVNNAMTTVFAPFKLMTPEDFRRVTEEPEDLSRPDNLREPVQGDYAAHGRFDDRAKNQSVQVWATEHIGWYRGAAAVAVITLAAAVGGALATLCQGRHKGEWGALGRARGGCCRRR